jgi:hypothetical protein
MSVSTDTWDKILEGMTLKTIPAGRFLTSTPRGPNSIYERFLVNKVAKDAGFGGNDLKMVILDDYSSTFEPAQQPLSMKPLMSRKPLVSPYANWGTF